MILKACGDKTRFNLAKWAQSSILAILATLAGGLGNSTVAFGQVETKTFQNAYISFDIPTTWDCEHDGVEFVCQEKDLKKVSSIAILAAKIIDPSLDTAAVYASELALQRTLKTQDGKLILSKPIDNRTRCIGGTKWQWGKQFQSELAGYFTEYFVTLTKGIAVLVTISYHTSVEADGREFARTLARNLRIIYQPKSKATDVSEESNCSSEN